MLQGCRTNKVTKIRGEITKKKTQIVQNVFLSFDKNSKQMNIIDERQVPTTINCKEAEPIKSPKTEEKSPRRAAKLLRRFSGETF